MSQTDELGKRLGAVADQLEEIRKKIVATKEGGAITGEERLREHTEDLYSALVEWEGRPAKYLVERIDVLKRELEDVKGEFNALVAEKLRPLNAQLEERKLQPIPTAATSASTTTSR